MNKPSKNQVKKLIRSQNCPRQRSKVGIDCIEEQLIQDLISQGYVL
jgi:hypothetical protein